MTPINKLSELTASRVSTLRTRTVQEAATVLLTSLMWELECLLHEYLSFNWDRIDDLLQANEDALR